MNSLKAIFTGRRRTDLLFVLMLILLLPLGAKDFRAGIIARGASDEFVSSFTSALEMGGSVLSSPLKTESAEKRLQRNEEFRAEREKAAAARSEREYRPSEKKPDDTPWRVVAVPLGDVPEEDWEFLLRGDPYALSSWMTRHDLDELWLLDGEERDGLEEVAVIRNGKEEMLFLTGHSFMERDERRMLSFFLEEYRDGEMHLLRVDGNVSAEITVDGEKAEMLGRYVLLEKPEAHILVSRPLYESAEYDVDTDLSETLEYVLSPIEGESVFISSIPYTDDITHDGEPAVGGYIPSPGLPFTVSLKEKDSESLVISSPVSTPLLEPVLFPSELRDEDRLLRARDRFYTDLMLTLSGFGLGVTCTVLDGMTEMDLAGVETFAYGLSVFQLIRTVDSLFSYKDAMRFGL